MGEEAKEPDSQFEAPPGAQQPLTGFPEVESAKPDNIPKGGPDPYRQRQTTRLGGSIHDPNRVDTVSGGLESRDLSPGEREFGAEQARRFIDNLSEPRDISKPKDDQAA